MKKKYVYVYVPEEHIFSIKNDGLLSCWAYYNAYKSLPVEKYINQYEEACVNYPDLKALTEGNPIEQQILSYLDWRVNDENTNLKGSKSIYFLWHPIPRTKTIKNFITTFRHNFLKDKVLLKFDIKDELTHHINPMINTNRGSSENWTRKDWIIHWKSQPKVRTNLWFEGIPHGFYIPESGKVEPSKIYYRKDKEWLLLKNL